MIPTLNRAKLVELNPPFYEDLSPKIYMKKHMLEKDFYQKLVSGEGQGCYTRCFQCSCCICPNARNVCNLKITYPIPSMGLVYLLTFTIKINEM